MVVEATVEAVTVTVVEVKAAAAVAAATVVVASVVVASEVVVVVVVAAETVAASSNNNSTGSRRRSKKPRSLKAGPRQSPKCSLDLNCSWTQNWSCPRNSGCTDMRW